MVDFNLDNGAPIKSGDVALILQQIDLLFDTTPKEVFGSEEYGTKYDEYLYKLDISTEALKYAVLSDIQSLNLFDFIPSIDIHLLHGTEQDIALIEITLERESESYQKVYKIS